MPTVENVIVTLGHSQHDACCYSANTHPVKLRYLYSFISVPGSVSRYTRFRRGSWSRHVRKARKRVWLRAIVHWFQKVPIRRISQDCVALESHLAFVLAGHIGGRSVVLTRSARSDIGVAMGQLFGMRHVY